MRFTVEPKVFAALSDLCIGVVVARGADGTRAAAEIARLLDDRIAEQAARLAEANVKELPEVARYREAFRTLGMNPNKYMCSIEALLSRVSKQKGLPHINGIVDLGNAVSLGHGFAIGAHDMDTFAGDMEVRYARVGDTADGEAPATDEIVYATSSDVRTRRWIWRQTESGKLGADTRNILFPIDGFLPDTERILSARAELSTLLKQYLGCETVLGFIDSTQPWMTIAD